MGERTREEGKKTYKVPILYLRKSEKGNHLYAFDVAEKDMAGKESGEMVLGGKTESLIMNVSDVQAVIDGKIRWAKVSVMRNKEDE